MSRSLSTSAEAEAVCLYGNKNTVSKLYVHYIRIYGSKPPRMRAKLRGQGWFTFAINLNVVDNKCYIPT